MSGGADEPGADEGGANAESNGDQTGGASPEDALSVQDVPAETPAVREPLPTTGYLRPI